MDLLVGPVSRTAIFKYLNCSLRWYCIVPRKKHTCGWNSKQKYKPYKLFKDEPLFSKAWSMLFISKSCGFQKLQENIAALCDWIQFTVLLLRKSHCPYGI